MFPVLDCSLRSAAITTVKSSLGEAQSSAVASIELAVLITSICIPNWLAGLIELHGARVNADLFSTDCGDRLSASFYR
jgi:hypothetical protein